MDKKSKLNLMKNRYTSLVGTAKNLKCQGCVKALAREIRNLENEISKENYTD